MKRLLSSLLLALSLFAVPAFGQYSAAPFVKPQYLDANGNPYASGKLYTYAAGGTSNLATYTTSDYPTNGAQNANPVVLDSAGRGLIYLQNVAYHLVLKDSAGATIFDVDNVWAIFSTSGTYTPTLTGVTNIAATTAFTAHYVRVGNQVSVAGYINVDPTAAAPTASEVGISLPIASNFTAEGDLGGSAASSSNTPEGAVMEEDQTNDRARMLFKALDTANHTFGFSFIYTVK